MVFIPRFNPWFFATEFVYTILIVAFCFMVFFRTREIYILSKHKGILFFRYAFVFFGLAYASRLILFLIVFSADCACVPHMMGRSFIPISNLIMAFFSTMAILYLAYSTIWRKIETEHFVTLSNIIAIFMGILAFVVRSPMTLSLMQFILMILAGVIIFTNHKKSRKKYSTKALYLLIFIVWTLSLLVLQSKHFIVFEIKILLQLISIALFIAIYLKVSKWTK